jgi:hypothetical protein
MRGGFLVTAAIASFSSQSATQVSFALQTTSSVSAAGGSGLAFTENGATYNGRSIALSDVSNDRSGRYTNAQKQQARQVQQQRDAQSTIAALDQLLPSQPGSDSQGADNGGVAVSLSPTALQLLNELNGQGGTNGTSATVNSTLSLSISVSTEVTAATVTAGSDSSTVSASAASAQYNAVFKLSASTVQS